MRKPNDMYLLLYILLVLFILEVFPMDGKARSFAVKENKLGLPLMLFAIVLILSTFDVSRANEDDPFFLKRKKMVEEQIKKRGICDEKVLDALLKVKRHFFVSAQHLNEAYEDYPLSIGFGQTISQPYIVAYMTEAANLKKDDSVLEIGTGSGYQAAILAEVAKEVYTIEIIKELAQISQQRLKNLGYKNIFVKQGDGYQGWREHAPFDAIIVTAAPNEIPNELVNQLKIGGRMVVPIGSFYQELYLITRTANGFDKKTLLPVQFVPMIKSR